MPNRSPMNDPGDSRQRERAAERRMNVRTAVGLLVVVAILAVYAWAVDFITLEGERTIYTAACVGGTWTGNRCGGDMVAGDRVRFRALKAHSEVLFWTAGAAEPAGKLTACEVTSERNWTCPASADASRSITLQMVRGKPIADAQGRTRVFHSVPKMQWLLLRAGVGWGATANE
jgi:hypothetical protein